MHHVRRAEAQCAFILMDDLGWGDLSATTGQFPTPNMDSLYTNSLQINRHYIHLMCSPSRTQFMTGRYAMNLGFGEFFPWTTRRLAAFPSDSRRLRIGCRSMA